VSARKGFQVVDGDGGACFGKAVAVGHGNSEVIEELQGLGFREGPAHDDGAQRTAERGVDLFEEPPAEPKSRAGSGERFVEGDKFVEDPALGGGQLAESRLQPLLQIFQNQRD
jgi:hypothetical protein